MHGRGSTPIMQERDGFIDKLCGRCLSSQRGWAGSTHKWESDQSGLHRWGGGPSAWPASRIVRRWHERRSRWCTPGLPRGSTPTSSPAGAFADHGRGVFGRSFAFSDKPIPKEEVTWKCMSSPEFFRERLIKARVVHICSMEPRVGLVKHQAFAPSALANPTWPWMGSASSP